MSLRGGGAGEGDGCGWGVSTCRPTAFSPRSLLNFLLPDIFGSLADFESWFDFSAVGQDGGDKEIAAQEQRNRVVSKLHSILK